MAGIRTPDWSATGQSSGHHTTGLTSRGVAPEVKRGRGRLGLVFGHRWRTRCGRRAFGALVVLSVAGAVTAGAAGRVADRDRTPPRFDGLMSATTCIPGPIGGGTTTRYHLSWTAAVDNRTPSGQIVYAIYQGRTAGGEDFSSPTYTTSRGATSFDTPPLPADAPVYFVVRARDRSGNQDANKVERAGVNPCV